ncbi:MAG: signal peptidase II [Patescibacteria group bacterium]|nr:signal peptidase II [Patescibacteria group bacterium]MDD5490811.1 signal peptidase II [Patescibacteria group bacterium]
MRGGKFFGTNFFWGYGAILFFFVVDRYFKYFVQNKLPDEGVYFIFPPFKFGLEFFRNKFIAFSIPLPAGIAVIFSAVILAGLFLFLYWLFRNGRRAAAFGLVILIAGALSNFGDRIIYGYVIDYVGFASLSFFNLADIMIAVGAFLFIIKYKGNNIKICPKEKF